MDEKKTVGGSFKGQAVMEYLITYGLALFVILIVLAILVAVVLPSLKAPETCQFTQPCFTCNQKPHVLVADSNNDVRILFQLDNTQGKSVNVLGIICTTAPVGNVRKSDITEGEPTGTPIQLAAGQSMELGGLNEEIECIDESGTTARLAPNSNFRGSVGVLYKFAEDLDEAPSRLAVATVTGSVQAEDE